MGELARWASLQARSNKKAFPGAPICSERNPNTPMANNGSPQHFHSLGETFQCLWDGEFAGFHCNNLIFGYDTSSHLQDRHGIRGPDDLHVLCRFLGCNTMIEKKNLAWHVQANHFGIRYFCNTCNQPFTCTYNLEVHKRICSYRVRRC
ncbi:hypothetical protein C8R48DRAFT_337903 [Suillus tomentosus]|nr:hypothetical protein C8R48DRAFT_337903 [Suillus tomentosus]